MNKIDRQPDSTRHARDFLASVVPLNHSGGYISIHWKHPGKKRFHGHSFQTIDAALQWVAQLKAGVPADIWFCISSQKLNKGHRDREHAIGLICLPMDLDIKPDNPKHYGTMAEAIAELFMFCIRFGIPRPSFIVATGGGLHVYWLSDRVLSVEEWQVYADAIKIAATSFGLKFDSTCTGDAARVLRMPGTLNWKYDPPRPVRLLQSSTLNYSNGVRHDFAAVFGKLLSEKPSRPYKIADRLADIKVAEAFKHLPVTPVDIVVGDYPPLPLEPILAECGWLRHVHDSGGIDQSEPLWKLALNVCGFLQEGEQLIHTFSKNHPGYDHDETKAKFERARQDQQAKDLGWPQCKTIEAAGSTHCKDCPHLAAGKSPLNTPGPDADAGVKLEDFYAYMPMHNYIFAPSREPWPASSVNARIPPVVIGDR